MTTLNARANQAYHAVVEEAGENWMGFSHQRAAFEEGWEIGYKTGQADEAKRVAAVLRSAVAGIEVLGGSEHWKHGRETMRDDALAAIDRMIASEAWS